MESCTTILLLSGFVKCYDWPYSSFATSNDLDACNGSEVVFVGAKSSNFTKTIAIGAFGTTNVLTVTNSTSTAYYDLGGTYCKVPISITQFWFRILIQRCLEHQ